MAFMKSIAGVSFMRLVLQFRWRRITMPKPIRVFYSTLSGRFYATRGYTISNGIVTVTGEKFDVTNDIGAAVREHRLEFLEEPHV